MKKKKRAIRSLSSLVCAFAATASVMLLACGCATLAGGREKRENPSPYGTWMNSEYNTHATRAAKIVYHIDGTWEAYKYCSSPSPCFFGTITIWKQWTGENGCCWYKVTTNQQGVRCIVYELWRLNKAGTMLEGVWKVGEVPSELNAADPTYTFYLRRGESTRQDTVEGRPVIPV